MKIRFTVEGSGGDSRLFSVCGALNADSIVNPEVMDRVFRGVFQELTAGAAIYGKPGQGGCHGPYRVKRIELVAQDKADG